VDRVRSPRVSKGNDDRKLAADEREFAQMNSESGSGALIRVHLRKSAAGLIRLSSGAPPEVALPDSRASDTE